MKKSKVITYITLSVLLIVVICTYFVTNSLDTMTIEEMPIYRYSLGYKEEINEKITLKKENSEIFFNYNNEKLLLNTSPLYFKNTTKLVLPYTTSIVNPVDSGKANKINYFSMLYQKDGCIFLESNDTLKELRDGFIYDGVDTYIFLEETIIEFNGSKYEVSPFSYIIAPYNGTMEMYLYDIDKYIIEDIENIEIVATSKKSQYQIHLQNDMLVKEEGQEQLLFKQVEKLDNLK